ncbi:MAG: hypothetical protein KA244_08645 [Deltaproteobacteria bacterium]|jgi:hypothetical protein|nr:hypothetical protein [Deltaproteobacteria bacterium]
MPVIRLVVLMVGLLLTGQALAQTELPPTPTATPPESPPDALLPVASDSEVPTTRMVSPSRFEKPKLSLGFVAGGSFQYLIETPFLSGGGELRLGALTRRVEVTARLRFLAGRSLAGLVLLQPSLTLGVMFPVSSRVRIGVDLAVPPLVRAMLIRYATRPAWGQALLAGLGMETNIDIVQGPGSRALFWVGTVGFDLTSVRPAGEGKEIVLGPNLFTGLGYRL